MARQSSSNQTLPHRMRRRLLSALAALVALPLVLCLPACGSSSQNASGSSSSSSSASSWISTVDWASHPATDTALSMFGVLTGPITMDALIPHLSAVNIATTGDSITDPSQLKTSDLQLDSDVTYDTFTLDSSMSSLQMSVSFSFYTNETSTVANAFTNDYWKMSLDSTSSSTIDSLLNVDVADEDASNVSDEGSVRLNAIIRTYGAPTYIWYYNSQFDADKASEGGAYDLVWERDGYAFDVVVQDVVSNGSTVADAAGFGYYPGTAWSREKEQLQSGYEDANGNKVEFKNFSDIVSKL